VNYPFDVYYAVCTLQVYSNKTALPLAVAVGGSVDSWNVLISHSYTYDRVADAPRIAQVILTFKRSVTTIFFCFFIGVIMWVLSLFAMGIAITVWTRNRKVEPPTIAVVGALLFALPAIRNSQVIFINLAKCSNFGGNF
jgi:hypothetical protein